MVGMFAPILPGSWMVISTVGKKKKSFIFLDLFHLLYSCTLFFTRRYLCVGFCCGTCCADSGENQALLSTRLLQLVLRVVALSTALFAWRSVISAPCGWVAAPSIRLVQLMTDWLLFFSFGFYGLLHSETKVNGYAVFQLYSVSGMLLLSFSFTWYSQIPSY